MSLPGGAEKLPRIRPLCDLLKDGNSALFWPLLTSLAFRAGNAVSFPFSTGHLRLQAARWVYGSMQATGLYLPRWQNPKCNIPESLKLKSSKWRANAEIHFKGSRGKTQERCKRWQRVNPTEPSHSSGTASSGGVRRMTLHLLTQTQTTHHTF